MWQDIILHTNLTDKNIRDIIIQSDIKDDTLSKTNSDCALKVMAITYIF